MKLKCCNLFQWPNFKNQHAAYFSCFSEICTIWNEDKRWLKKKDQRHIDKSFQLENWAESENKRYMLTIWAKGTGAVWVSHVLLKLDKLGKEMLRQTKGDPLINLFERPPAVLFNYIIKYRCNVLNSVCITIRVP